MGCDFGIKISLRYYIERNTDKCTQTAIIIKS